MITLQPTDGWPNEGEYLVTTQSVHVRCMGKCKKLFTLCDHKIDANGNITPSVVCPTGAPGDPLRVNEEHCGWHVNLKLDGWTGLKEPTTSKPARGTPNIKPDGSYKQKNPPKKKGLAHTGNPGHCDG